MAKETRPPLSAVLRRALRQEVNFCCPVCGNPLLEYHHIVPWRHIKAHHQHEMLALCPNCHAKADNAVYSKELLRALKQRGFDTPGWKETIRLQSPDYYAQIGNVRIEKPGDLLRVYGTPLLTMKRRLQSNVLLSTYMYDKHGRVIMCAVDNEITIQTAGLWDVQYNGKSLILRKKPYKVILELEFNSERIWFKRGSYHLLEVAVEFEPANFKMPGLVISGPGPSRVGGICIYE